MSFITACIIVKNDAVNLERCLNSIKDYMDEIVIVDTGSTDNSLEVAQKYTQKAYASKIYTQDSDPLEFDFSQARNEALTYCTSQWVMSIDSDEELVIEDWNAFKNLLITTDFPVHSINVIHLNSNNVEHLSTRILLNHKNIQWVRSVHEIPSVYSQNVWTPIEFIKFNHYGKFAFNHKRVRNRTLLKKQLEKLKMKTDLYYLALEYYGEDPVTSFGYAALYHEFEQKDHPQSEYMMLVLQSRCLQELKFYNYSYKFAEKAIQHDPTRNEAYWLKADALAFMGMFEEAKKVFEHSLTIPFPKNSIIGVNPRHYDKSAIQEQIDKINLIIKEKKNGTSTTSHAGNSPASTTSISSTATE